MPDRRVIRAPRVAVVVSRYNGTITDALLEGALRGFHNAFPGSPAPTVLSAPGSFELPAIAHGAAASGRFAGVVALGCIIKGETSHDQHLAAAVTTGLVNVSIASGVPVSLGVLTVGTPRQARDRAGGRLGNKGQEAMEALLFTVAELARLAAPAGASRNGKAPPATPLPMKHALPDKAAARARRRA